MEVVNTVEVAGALYGAVQAVANALCLVLPKNTIAFKFCKWLIAGVSRVE